MTEKLDEISVPFHSAIHGDHCCTNLDHVNAIQSYYESIVTAIHFADRILSRAKNQSISTTDNLQTAGSNFRWEVE